jgi:hypothetical protein
VKFREITAEQLALETSNFLGQASRSPLIVRRVRGPALVIRPIGDDEVAEELILRNPRFGASIRCARRNRRAGKGISLD